MSNPTTFYTQQKEKHQVALGLVKKRLLGLSSIRLVVFLATIFGIYLFFGQTQTILIVVAVGIALFLFLVSRYTDLQKERDVLKALIHLNEEELLIAKGDFHHRNEGRKFTDPSHFYSHDIDLFGRGSFFQYINRSVTKQGKKLLADSLTANNIHDIKNRQDGIKELAAKPKWRQYFSAVASTIKTETPTKTIIDWTTAYRPFMPKIMKWLPTIFSLATVALFVLVYMGMVSFGYVFALLAVGLAVTGVYLKKINILSSNADRVKDTFRQYSLLLNQVEKEVFVSGLLREQQKLIESEGKKASLVFKEFSKALDALDNRNNIFSAIFANGFMLWDIKQTYKIEKWISTYGSKVVNWFEVVAFFDAYNSLGNFAFNHPSYVFPKINGKEGVIKAKNLGHPLLDESKRVDNDIEINNHRFFIVTGANMAGKSTFLRTVSLHIVMANTGLPVCATESSYSPVKLITSMRTSDSLTDDASYFYSELTRLKFIVDEIAKEPYFIVLDEILKGTNSTDKAIGSKKFVEKLVAGNATGIIATHDLSLCRIEDELPQIKNYYFDAEIINDELHFDYTFKEGVCKNMNASFLLKKMQIV